MAHGEISLKTYVVVFVALLILLVVTLVVATVDFGVLSLPIALAVASAKAFLIAVYFMHLKVSSRWITAFFVSSLYILIIGGIIIFSDYLLRR